METIPFLTKEDVIELDDLLGDYLQKSDAAFTVVIDRGGTVIAQCGEGGDADITIVAALAAGSFAATKELARRIGESEFSALYHQGQQRHIFMSALDEHTIIITLFDEKTTVGLVRFYTVNVTPAISALLSRLRSREAPDIPELSATGTMAPFSPGTRS
ncbi:MAG: roadblock/LC7 domain-containing protein [Verrucomicrobiae bacterium]|nr:roadblock/LC7 domain-containing protein [Verrucomicrobiae bacterium]